MEHSPISNQHMNDIANQVPDFDMDSVSLSEVVSRSDLPSLCFKRKLLALENINDSSGHCVLVKGQPLKKKLAELISQRSLARSPRDFSRCEENIGLERLLIDLDALLVARLELSQLDRAYGATEIWRNILVPESLVLGEYQAFLTVLASELPAYYEQSLFCSWLAALLASTLQLDHEKTRALVLAGLFHQVGRLYLSDELKGISENSCNDSVWDEFQMHVIHGRNMLKGASCYTEDIGRFIEQQGEYLNGLGFPFATESDKCEDGVLCLCRDIYMRFIVGKLRLDKLGVFLQVHQLRYGLSVCWAMKHLLKGGVLTSEYAPSGFDLTQTTENIIRQSIVIAQFDVMLSVLLKAMRVSLRGTMAEYLVKTAEKLVIQIELYMKNSGISDVEFLISIDDLANGASGADAAEVEEFLGAQSALIELFAEVGRVLAFALEVVDKDKYREAYEEMQSVALLIKDTLMECETCYVS